MKERYNRTERITHEIKKNISIILQYHMQDSRLGIVTISKLDVSRDLSYAKVFVTFLNENDLNKIKNNIKILQHASGFIRKMLGKIMNLRILPELAFIYDNFLIESMQLTSFIKKNIKKNFYINNTERH